MPGGAQGPGRSVRCSSGWGPRAPASAVPPGEEAGLGSPQAVGLQGQPGLGEDRAALLSAPCPPGGGGPLCGSAHCLLTFWVRFARCGISSVRVLRVPGGCPSRNLRSGAGSQPFSLSLFIFLIFQQCCISASCFPHCQFPSVDYRAFFLTLKEFYE